MIDGLNEVKALINPEARAKEAVIKLWKAFAPELPMVLGIRPRRGWMLGDPHERFTVRNALLNTWQRPHIETYLKRRWGEGDSRVGEFLKGLAEGSAHETLLGTPLFLNLQCELWEAGATTLLANRAHLLASMVWLRLGQELAKATVQAGQIRGPLGGLDMLSPLELQRAREFVANPGMPPEFPRQGWLLKGLFAQAKAQWLAKPEADPQLVCARPHVGPERHLADEVLARAVQRLCERNELEVRVVFAARPDTHPDVRASVGPGADLATRGGWRAPEIRLDLVGVDRGSNGRALATRQKCHPPPRFRACQR